MLNIGLYSDRLTQNVLVFILQSQQIINIEISLISAKS